MLIYPIENSVKMRKLSIAVPKQNFPFRINIISIKEISRVTSLAKFSSLSSVMLSFAFERRSFALLKINCYRSAKKNKY